MLINLTNHPHRTTWKKEQTAEARRRFGKIYDITFPEIQPADSPEIVGKRVDRYIRYCKRIFAIYQILRFNRTHYENAVHVMGEMTFVYQFVKKMSEQQIRCIASTSERIVTVETDGRITKDFKFVQFRPYE